MVTPQSADGKRRPPVVMLGGGGSTLSVVRSLGRAGIAVQVLGDPTSIVRFSRYCTEFVDLGAASDVQERWLEWLEQAPAGAVVMTCHDDGLELVARNRDRLVERGLQLLEADDEVLLAMLDKELTYELARAAGVPVPRTWIVADAGDLERAAAEAPYPCAIKPRHSHLFVREFGSKMLVAHDESELRSAYDRTRDAGLELIVTEIVPGRHDQHYSYYTFIDEKGEPLFHLTKRKLRQYPIGQGLGSYHVTDWNPEVAALGLELVRAVGLRGLANPEFKRDERDGQLKLIEVNHRFTAVNELVRAAGIDLALLAYGRLAGWPQQPLDGYRRGVRYWLPSLDVRAAIDYRRAGELTVLEWLRSIAHRQHPALFSGDDPLPSLANLPLRALNALRARRPGAPGLGAS